MQFKTNAPLPIMICPQCEGTGYRTFRMCPSCGGMSMGMMQSEQFSFYGEPLTAYHIYVKKARQVLNYFRLFGGLFFFIVFCGLFFWFVNIYQWWEEIFQISFWLDEIESIKAFFWIGIIFLSYSIYRIIVSHETKPEIIYNKKQDSAEVSQPIDGMTWGEIRRLPGRDKVNIAHHFTDKARMVLEDAYSSALKSNVSSVTAAHIFYALLGSSEIAGIFIRLGIPVSSLRAKLAQSLGMPKRGKHQSPKLSSEIQQIIFHAYILSRSFNDTYVRTAELLLATVQQSEMLQELLYDLEIDNQKLSNVIEWVRTREKLYEQYRMFRRAAARMSKHGMDRAMTAVATPMLNTFSKDLTLLAKYGHMTPCVARDKEIDEIFRIVEAGKQNVILVGEHGVGKTSIIEGVVQRMIAGNAPNRLHDKRFVQISTSSLLAGTTLAGAQERLIRIMNEVSRARNIILFINGLHDLTGLTDGKGEGLDMSEALAEQLRGNRFLMFATTLPDAYNRNIVRSEIGSMFTKVQVSEMDTNQAIQVLESKAGSIEYKQNVFFSYDAIEQCVVLAAKFFYDQNLPESAIALMSEVGSFVRNSKGENHLVEKTDVGTIVSEKTGVPVAVISEDESQKLLRLEDQMHTHVIGQDVAVNMVANALRRARADVRSQKKPIASFLFLGPTGVGKTELAKTIATVYFGGVERMIRIDMSEYQDKSGIYRLIGQPGQQGTGLLTEAVRQNPFSLILLDELEKADADVLNLFLQVFDDGRLTDSVGRVVDFTNTIIIATSNAGTAYVQEELNRGVEVEVIREHLIRGELKQYYRPEFLNRFDGIVLFKPLTRNETKQIASLMLKRLAQDLETRGVGLRIEESALEALADVGFDPEFGARPMRRAIQDRIENHLAELILQNKLKRRDTVVLGEACQIHVESK